MRPPPSHKPWWTVILQLYLQATIDIATARPSPAALQLIHPDPSMASIIIDIAMPRGSVCVDGAWMNTGERYCNTRIQCQCHLAQLVTGHSKVRMNRIAWCGCMHSSNTTISACALCRWTLLFLSDEFWLSNFVCFIGYRYKIFWDRFGASGAKNGQAPILYRVQKIPWGDSPMWKCLFWITVHQYHNFCLLRIDSFT